MAIIEARMTSSRLPGKVLLPITGMPALEMLISRLSRSRFLDAICVATTSNSSDDSLVALAQKLRVEYFRGSESDVLGRVLGAAHQSRADIIVEITGDCPFVDPELVDRGIEEFVTHDVDYASNTIEPTYPNGFDVQVFPTSVLADVSRMTDDPIDRTHVSYYIYMHPEKYRCHNWKAPPESYGPELRVTLDEQDDYEALNAIAQALQKSGPGFTAHSVVQFLRQNPDVVAINKHIRQKEIHEL